MAEQVSTQPPAQHVEQLRRQIDEALSQLVQEPEPEGLYAPVRHVLAGRGKRLRPLLVLLSAEAFGASPEDAMPAALAVEVFHNFTLVHDDIMDNADSRRGRATVHLKWDASTAILSGDYLMALSYDLLAQANVSDLRPLLKSYFQMVARLCEGQTLDKVYEERSDVSVDDYLRMIDRKTAALIETALELGGRVGGADSERLAALGRLGRELGRAFQIQDDLLDLTADDDRWGKQIGGDLVEGKKTFLLLRALERASGAERAWFVRIVEDGGLPEDEVEEGRRRMQRLGVLDEAEAAVQRHYASARKALGSLSEGAARDALHWLVDRMEGRLH